MTEVTATPIADTEKKKVTIISSAVANEKYPRVLGMKTPGGSPIRDCGDRVAVALRGTGMDDWMEIAERNGIRENLEALQSIGKNVGQIRMALGRMLRARLIKHEAAPDKEVEPFIPEPKPMPVKAGPVTPKPTEQPQEDVDQTGGMEDDEELGDEEEDSEDDQKE